MGAVEDAELQRARRFVRAQQDQLEAQRQRVDRAEAMLSRDALSSLPNDEILDRVKVRWRATKKQAAVLRFVCAEMINTDTQTRTHTLTLSLTHTHAHSHTHSLSVSLVILFAAGVFAGRIAAADRRGCGAFGEQRSPAHPWPRWRRDARERLCNKRVFAPTASGRG